MFTTPVNGVTACGKLSYHDKRKMLLKIKNPTKVLMKTPEFYLARRDFGCRIEKVVRGGTRAAPSSCIAIVISHQIGDP